MRLWVFLICLSISLPGVTAVAATSASKPYDDPDSAPTELNRIWLDAKEYPNAVCTDGSRAGYYYKFTGDANSVSSIDPSDPRLWVFWLQGGGWCWHKASCKRRCGTPDSPRDSSLCSSKDWPKSLKVDGIMGDLTTSKNTNIDKSSILAKPRHLVYVHYCTSDGHMGNAEAMGWQFRGHVVVKSVIEDVVKRFGLGKNLNPGEKTKDLVVFGGGSAGGRGAMVHLEYVKGMIQDAVQFGSSTKASKDYKNLEVVGLLDSPLWMNVEPLYPPPWPDSWPGDAETTKAIHKYANVKHIGKDCENKYPNKEKDQWKCMFGEYRLGLIDKKVSYLLVASQNDMYQEYVNLQEEVWGKWPDGAEEYIYCKGLSNRTRKDVEELAKEFSGGSIDSNSKSNKNLLQSGLSSEYAPRTLYSWKCFNHAVSTLYTGFRMLTCPKYDVNNGVSIAGTADKSESIQPLTIRESLDRLLAKVWRKMNGETYPNNSEKGENLEVYMDTCDGFSCGKGCGNNIPDFKPDVISDTDGSGLMGFIG